MGESNAMSSRILRTIEQIIKTDHQLHEFTIVPTEDNTKNKSPVLYEQHALGLESWCVKHVYRYACSMLFEHRKQLSAKKLTYDKMEDLNHALIGALLINPEVGTFWNMKRELVERDVLTIEEELHFSKVVLMHNSKSNEAFSYRRWLLKKILNKMTSNYLSVPLTLLQNEFEVIHAASEKAANNYHSWMHRIWCMENFGSESANIGNIVLSELSYSQQWINMHVSEHAGYHYRQYLIKLIKNNKNIGTIFDSYYNFTTKTLLKVINDGEYVNLLIYLLGKPTKPHLVEENYAYINYVCVMLYDVFVMLEKINEIFPEHESLYYHRRFLIHHLLNLPYEYHNVVNKKRGGIGENNVNLCGRNITECDEIVNIPSSDSDNAWPKLVKFNRTNYLLYDIISDNEKKFLGKNGGNCEGKYRKWLMHLVGFE